MAFREDQARFSSNPASLRYLASRSRSARVSGFSLSQPSGNMTSRMYSPGSSRTVGNCVAA